MTNDDVIRYNPEKSLPSDTDKDGILIHELAHRADTLGYQVAKAQKWTEAIQKVETVVAEAADAVQSWFYIDGKSEREDRKSREGKRVCSRPLTVAPGTVALIANREDKILSELVPKKDLDGHLAEVEKYLKGMESYGVEFIEG